MLLIDERTPLGRSASDCRTMTHSKFPSLCKIVSGVPWKITFVYSLENKITFQRKFRSLSATEQIRREVQFVLVIKYARRLREAPRTRHISVWMRYLPRSFAPHYLRIPLSNACVERAAAEPHEAPRALKSSERPRRPLPSFSRTAPTRS